MADRAVWQRTIVDERGNIIPGAEVTVRSYPGGSLVTLYESPEGAPKSNPFVTGHDGFARFWADSQRVEIVAVGAGGSIRWIVDLLNADEVIGDAVSEATAAAAVAVGEAEAAADRAEAARDAAVSMAPGVYPDTAAGLAATTDGDYFSVPSEDDDEYLILYRNDNGSAEEVERYPSVGAVDHAIEYSEQITRVAVDLASEPGEMPSEFYSDADQAVFAFVNEQGDTIAAFDQDGRWHAWQPADAEFSRSSMDLAFAHTDEDGQVLWGVEESGHFWSRQTRHEFSGAQDENPAFAFAYTDEDGRVLWGVESSGHFWGRETRHEFSDPQYKGLAFAYTDEDGRILLGFDEQGKPHFFQEPEPEPEPEEEPERVPLLPYLDGTTLHAVGADDVVAADLGSYTALSIAPGNQNSVRAVLDWPAIGPTRSVSAGDTVDDTYRNGLLVPDADNVLHIVIGLGQSLMVGATSASSLVSTEAEFPEDVLMFDAGPHSDVRMGLTTQGGDNDVLDPADLVGFLPLVAKVGQGGGSRGETPMEGFANALEREAQRLGIRYRVLNFTAAQGGTGYLSLKKGTQIYDNMLAAVARAKQLAEAEGWQVIVDGCIVRHGESNASNPSYGDYLLEWQEDVDADIRDITGQQAPVHFLIAQPSSFMGDDTQAAPLMVDIHNSSPFHHVSGPDYGYMDLYHSDALHGTGPFYYINGEYLARAWAQALWSSHGKSRITQITAAERNGTTVTLTYEVPEPPLQIDTTTVSERDNKGFRYRDSNGEIEVVDVAVTHEGVSTGGIGTIKLTLGSTPSGNGEQVLYAMSGKEESGDIATLARGNVRDSARRTSTYDGRRLYNWGVHQKVDVNVQ